MASVINGTNIVLYKNETNSLQLIEIYYDESLIFLVPTYVTDVDELGPFWYLNFNTNL
jgi:hypothetical protein